MTPLSNTKIFCIYHGNCADGFGAAWAVRHALGDGVEFYAGSHGKLPPDCTGRDVVMVDFSYKRDVLLAIAVQAKSILILDHHISAQKDLVDLPQNITTVFDMDKSGAILAWEHFNEGEPPQLLKHIEDRDLWRFNIDGTRQVQAALFSYSFDFELWDKFIGDDISVLQSEGVAIERKQMKDVNSLIGAAAARRTIAGFDVPTLNAPYMFSSDAGHIMGKNEPFAACYYETGTSRYFSLRSHPDGEDVSEIAVKYGGGGHKHAAGFKTKLDDEWPS